MTNTAGPAGPERSRGFPGRVLDAVVGSVVPPVVDRIDVEDVVERIDVDALLARVDLDAVLARLDLDAVLARVDLDSVLERVDLDAVLDRVDVNRVLDRVDADRLLDRVTPDRLLDRVDVDALVARLDVDAVLDRVDIDRLVERTELRTIIARSTTGVFTEVLDVARTQFTAVDQTTQAVGGVFVRPRRGRDDAPGTPSAPDDRPVLRGLSRRERAVALQGHHAGSVSRFVAFLADAFAIGVLFGAAWALIDAALEVVLGRTVDLQDARWLVALMYSGWWLIYFAGSWAAAGRTIGMTLLGVMVVSADGSELHSRQALLRAVCFPISALVFGVGFLLGLVRRDRRQLHDLLARTAVVYAWDAAEAQLRAQTISSQSAS